MYFDQSGHYPRATMFGAYKEFYDHYYKYSYVSYMESQAKLARILAPLIRIGTFGFTKGQDVNLPLTYPTSGADMLGLMSDAYQGYADIIAQSDFRFLIRNDKKRAEFISYCESAETKAMDRINGIKSDISMTQNQIDIIKAGGILENESASLNDLNKKLDSLNSYLVRTNKDYQHLIRIKNMNINFEESLEDMDQYVRTMEDPSNIV